VKQIVTRIGDGVFIGFPTSAMDEIQPIGVRALTARLDVTQDVPCKQALRGARDEEGKRPARKTISSRLSAGAAGLNMYKT